MIQHIALTINNPDEITNFYKDVFMVEIHHQFSLTRDLSQMIFNREGDFDVSVMRNDEMEFELFLTDEVEKKVFSHTCLSFKNSQQIMEKAQKAGYRTVIKPRNDGCDTYFIWDKSGNLFEVKEKQ
ncbi:MAG TPA: VOC family protein [Prolixibacteraceae bacterium]|nr:VOC family protein [Prolixibacteraceae bacterium]